MNSSHQVQALPNDIFEIISQFLKSHDIASLASTSKEINEKLKRYLNRKMLEEYSIKQICFTEEDDDIECFFLGSKGDVWHYFLFMGSVIQKQMTKLPKIKSMTSILNNIIFLSQEGEVWVMGRNSYGQLGNAPGSFLNHYAFPCRLELPPIIQVVSGVFNNYFLDKHGIVWYLGSELFGDYEWNPDVEKNSIPRKVNGLPEIIKIFHRVDFDLFLDKQGNVWGSGTSAYLFDFRKTKVPTKINGLSSIKDIVLGREDRRAFFISQNDEVWVMGDNSNGALGLGHTEHQESPVAISTLSSIERIVASEYTTFFIDKNKTLYVSGKFMGALCLNPIAVSSLGRIKDIILNDDHIDGAVIINEEGRAWVYSDKKNHEPSDSVRYFERVSDIDSIDNAFIHKNNVIFLDKEGNIKRRKENSLDTPVFFTSMNKQYNFMANHHFDILSKRFIPFTDLLHYACARHEDRDNKVYFDVVINLLRRQDRIIRFFVLNSLQDSPWFDAAIQSEFLFVYQLAGWGYTTNFTIKEIVLSVYRAIFQLYDFLKESYKERNESNENNINDFIDFMKKINENQPCSKKELEEILSSNLVVTNKKSFLFFSLKITVPDIFDRYTMLCQNLLKVTHNDEACYALNRAVRFFIKMINAFEGEDVFLQRLKTQIQSVQLRLS